MKEKILIIDDDEKLDQLLVEYFAGFGLEARYAAHPAQGLELIADTRPDLVVLDVMLPDMDGFETLKKIRQTSQVPVIMLTARGEVTDRVLGLHLGADDYLPKPFEPRELVARIKSVLRRWAQAGGQETPACGPLNLDINRREAELDGCPLELTTNEFEVLHLLMRKRGQVLTRDDILEEMRGLEWDAFNRSVDIAISRLRAKLGDNAKTPRFIKTIWGEGYKFIG